MNADLLVGIWVSGEGWNQPEFATGYPVAPDRILTVGHIFKHGWNKVEVWAVYREKSSRVAEVVWPKSDFVWSKERADQEFDAVLLNWSFEEDRPSRVRFLEEPPQRNLEWFSNCFPSFARDDGPPGEYLDAQGKFNPSPDGPTFQLACDDKRENPQDWGGASGGPIFVGNHLAGMIKGVRLGRPTKLPDGRVVAPLERLEGVPAWKLVKAPEFQDCLDGDFQDEFDQGDQDWHGELVLRLKNELRDLISQVEIAELFQLELKLFKESGAELLDRICEKLAADSDLVPNLAVIRRGCRRRGLTAQANELEEVENHLLPRTFTPAERLRFWDALRNSGAVLIERAVSCPAGAEGWIASIDRRKTDFPRGSQEQDVKQWPGRSMMQPGKVTPKDPAPESVAYRILRNLAADRLGADDPDGHDARDEIATGHVRTKRSEMEDADLIARELRKTLQTRQKAYGTQYCLIRVDETGLTRERLKEALPLLKQWVPEIDFLEIYRESPAAEHEAPMIELLRMRNEDTD